MGSPTHPKKADAKYSLTDACQGTKPGGLPALLSNQITDYCCGLYGRPPAPIDSEIQKLLLKRFRRGQNPIDVRPADLLEPELNAAREAVRSFTNDIGDVLTAALYPITGLQFLKRKYGVETSPEEAPAKPAGE